MAIVTMDTDTLYRFGGTARLALLIILVTGELVSDAHHLVSISVYIRIGVSTNSFPKHTPQGKELKP